MEWNKPSKKVVQPSEVVDILLEKPAYDPLKDAMVRDNNSEERRGDFEPCRLEESHLCDTKLATLTDHFSRHFPNSGLLTFWDDIDDGIREPSGTNHHLGQTDT